MNFLSTFTHIKQLLYSTPSQNLLAKSSMFKDFAQMLLLKKVYHRHILDSKSILFSTLISRSVNQYNNKF